MTLGRRLTWKLLVGALLAQILAVGLALAPANQKVASAAEMIALTKDGPTTVLAGGQATYTLTVTNPGDVADHNVSFSDSLPPGVAYVPGSVDPAAAGEPSVSTDPVTGQQVLVWGNVADLPPGSSYTITFTVQFAPDALVGADVQNSARAATNSDPRQVPDFDASGNPVPGSFTQAAEASHTTRVTALEITKSSTDTPEGELLRGVHDHRSTYTLRVTDTGQDGTDDVQVADYLPASLEFLGCGDVDHTFPPGSVEYPGAPRLGVPPLAPASCVTPISVDTVVNPPAAGGVAFPPGVYTKVVWDVGDLAAGTSIDIAYVAGIPLRENTATFAPGPRPTAASLNQGSNLGNNNGASTRETATERSATNRAGASGAYQGTTIDGVPSVTATISHTVTLEDVRMRKSVTPPTFSSESGADIAEFTLVVDTSEYVNADGLALTDVLPGAYCPLGGSANYAPDSPSECDPGGGSPPTGASYDSVSFDPTAGAYTIRFELDDLDENDTTTVTFQARMRTEYTGGTHDGEATVAGDSFTNRATVDGQTTPVPGTGEVGSRTVSDDSQATQSTAGPTVDKQTKPRDVSNLYTGDPAVDCAVGTLPAYGQSSAFTPPQRTFRAGDQICFKLRMDFPVDVSTRTPIVTDFIPFDTRYIAGSWYPTPANDVTVANFGVSNSTPAATSDALAWQLGDPDGGVLFVQPGATFEVTFAVEVVDPAAPPTPDLLGNLMKARWTDTDGTAFSSRDYEDFDIAPGANMTLQKGVLSVDSPASGPNAPNTDGSIVEEGSSATFRIDLTNLGRDGYPGADFSVRGVHTWDVLPVGIDCGAVSDYGVVTHGPSPPATAISPDPLSQHVTCTDPGDPGHPTVSPGYGDSATQSVIAWEFPTPDLADDWSIFVGESMTLTYTMALPAQIGVTTRFDNVAGVAEFGSFTNLVNQTAQYYPADNISADNAPEANTQAADDPSWVTTANAGALKTQVTSIDESNNNLLTQATIGELVTYDVSVTVPAHSTVYDGLSSDPMPTGLTFVSATGLAVPAGGSVDPSTGTLTFPSTYQNATGSPETFTVRILAQVSTLGANTHGTIRTNTTTFTSNATPGGSPLPARTASTALSIVEPNPSIAKAANPTQVIGGQTVTYRLTAANANGRPPSHDTQVIDCLPAGVTFGVFTSTPPGSTTGTSPGTGSNGCGAGTTRIQWDAGTVLAGSANAKVLTYTGIVDPMAIGGQTYTNVATLTGTTLNDGSSVPNPAERTYTRTAQATITVVGLDITKGVSPDRATIGDEVSYEVTVRIPANVNYLRTSIVDTLPDGLSTTLTDTSAECTVAGTGAPCVVPSGFTQLPTVGQQVGLYVGDVPAETDDRFITVRYTTTVLDDPSDTAGQVKPNSAVARWTTDNSATIPTTIADALALPDGTGPATADVTIIEPDLAITKDVSNPTPSGADLFGYEVTITNSSGVDVSEAHEVDITDDIPTGVVVSPLSITDGGVLTGADPTTGGGTITWSDLGPIAAAESLTLRYAASLAPSADLTGAPLTNTATIDSYWSLPSATPDAREYTGPSDDATVTPQFPHFDATKTTPGGDIALVGQPFAWRFDVTNTGGADGFAVTASDVLPPNWTYVTGSATVTNPQSGGTPRAVEPTVNSAAGPAGSTVQTLTFSGLGDLGTAGTLRVDYEARPTPLAPTYPGVGMSVPHANTITPGGADSTGATANSNGTYAGPDATADAFLAAADLRLVKRADPVEVDAGGTAAWTIDVDNLGPDPAVAPFTITDTLPEGTSYVPGSTSPWACTLQGDQSTLTCTLSTPTQLTAGQALPTLRIRTTVPADALPGERYTNIATVTSPTVDTNIANNTDSAYVEVNQADLAILKTHTGTPQLGDDVTFDLAVSNLGPSTAKDVVVTDAVPAGLTPTAWSGSPDWTCTITGQDLDCELAADLPAGSASDPYEAPPLSVTAKIGPAAAPAVDNTAYVSASTPDPEPDNNQSTDQLAVDPVVDLWIQKTHTADFVIGTQGTFTLQVGNNGPTVNPGPLTVTDTLPDGLSYVAATGTDWACAASGQVVTCTNPGPAPIGWTSTISLVVDVLPPAAPSVTNTASVTSPATDIDPVNNTDDDVVVVGSEIALSLVKTGTMTTDTTAVWTLAVTNDGPSPTTGPIVVTDPLPAGLTYVSAGGPGWTCTSAGRNVTCEYAAVLDAGETATFTLTTAVQQASTGETIVNTATATTDGGTPSPSCPAGTDACDSAHVDVEAAAADRSPGSGSRPATGLAWTGSSFMPWLTAGLALVLVGALVVWFDRHGRRRHRLRRSEE